MGDNRPRDEGPDDDTPEAAHRVFREVCHEETGSNADYGPFNPAKSAKQQKMMGADLARARKGKKTRTGMSEGKLREMARKPKGGY